MIVISIDKYKSLKKSEIQPIDWLYNHEWVTDQSTVENAYDTNVEPHETIITCDDNEDVFDGYQDLIWLADKIIIYHDIMTSSDNYLESIAKLIRVYEYLNKLASKAMNASISESEARSTLRDKITITSDPISDNPNAIMKLIQYV